jgi:hypothetical protein
MVRRRYTEGEGPQTLPGTFDQSFSAALYVFGVASEVCIVNAQVVWPDEVLDIAVLAGDQRDGQGPV